MLNHPEIVDQSVIIPCQKVSLEGILNIPEHSQGIILFAHGSGSSRLSPRNQKIAKKMQNTHFATLLFDLLTPQEDTIDNETLEFRFDMEFLSDRLVKVSNWVRVHPDLKSLPIGYFGASTGGGAALIAAAKDPTDIKAVVSRGGRPDLAKHYLKKVEAPTLLIVGSLDIPVIELNKIALDELESHKKLVLVEGATHLFEEPGKLDEVAKLTIDWFKKYMV